MTVTATRLPGRVRIGTLHVTKPHTLRQADYECAAWWREVELQPGDYPIMAQVRWGGWGSDGHALYESGQIDGGNVWAKIDGVEGASDFSSYFVGQLIGGGRIVDRAKGQPTTFIWGMACYSLAGQQAGLEASFYQLPDHLAITLDPRVKVTTIDVADDRQIAQLQLAPADFMGAVE